MGLATSVTSTMKSRRLRSKVSLASRSRTSSPRWTDSSSLTDMASSCLHLGQLDLLKNWKEGKGYKNDVYLLPKELDEKVARLHLPALGAQLTTLSKEQADYIGVKVEGPYKGDTYRY